MMKIVAGLGSIDEYIPYAEAGADELFCGYVPESWALKYGMMSPLNRREVLYYNVQIGSKSELQILQKMIQHCQVPVTMTFNSLYYTPEQYPIVGEIIRECRELGFDSFIIADPALLLYLKQSGIRGCRIHLSGETAEVNHLMIDEMREFDIDRVIFHRKNTLKDMQSCIGYEKTKYPDKPLEYEAFVLNEMCHFTGAFCNSLHCDELTHICRLPYRLEAYEKSPDEDLGHRGSRYRNSECRRCGEQKYEGKAEEIRQEETHAENGVFDGAYGYLTGRSGCGLCALWKMRQAGITHLKLVSRGNYTEDTMEDIRQLRRALEILEQSETEQEYKAVMRERLFFGDCSHSCYYL